MTRLTILSSYYNLQAAAANPRKFDDLIEQGLLRVMRLRRMLRRSFRASNTPSQNQGRGRELMVSWEGS